MLVIKTLANNDFDGWTYGSLQVLRQLRAAVTLSTAVSALLHAPFKTIPTHSSGVLHPPAQWLLTHHTDHFVTLQVRANGKGSLTKFHFACTRQQESQSACLPAAYSELLCLGDGLHCPSLPGECWFCSLCLGSVDLPPDLEQKLAGLKSGDLGSSPASGPQPCLWGLL